MGGFASGERPFTFRRATLLVVAFAIPCVSGALVLTSVLMLLPRDPMNFGLFAGDGSFFTAALNVTNLAVAYGISRTRTGPPRFRGWLQMAGLLSGVYLAALVVLVALVAMSGG